MMFRALMKWDMMSRRFRADRRGNFTLMTAVLMAPLLGALALGVDYSQMSRQRQAALNALDAAGIATARYIAAGADDTAARTYANQFFEANLGPVDPDDTTLTVTLPNDNISGGGTLEMQVSVAYHPYFLPAFHYLLGIGGASDTLTFSASNEIRLKNTLEVALVLDNSGSMDDEGSGSSERRIDLLKEAAKELVTTLAGQAALMKQIEKPVQFGLVPFAGAVNVGADNANAAWMDTDGVSPVHHENFDWSTMPEDYAVTKAADGIYRKTGADWGSRIDQKVTRFSLFDAAGTSWAGCVETRPYPYSLNDAAVSYTLPETLFVPMFAPDETDYYWAYNDWHDDRTSGSALYRQKYMPKYFLDGSSISSSRGPNQGCTTKAITPLTDVSTSTGLDQIKAAIDGMTPLGATNVPEGLAWGWRVVSSTAPFIGGRSENEHGNDKVVIVLTDGANTYYTPSSLGARDDAGNKSIYSTYGYARNGRIFDGTTVDDTDFSNGNYTKAMNEQMSQLCENAKGAGLIVMTVALDLDSDNTTEAAQIDALKKCASDSRFRRDPADPSKPAKLFWNATGASLSDDFEAIGDELSNLRIVG